MLYDIPPGSKAENVYGTPAHERKRLRGLAIPIRRAVEDPETATVGEIMAAIRRRHTPPALAVIYRERAIVEPATVEEQTGEPFAAPFFWAHEQAEAAPEDHRERDWIQSSSRLTSREIIATACMYFGFTRIEMTSQRRTKRLSDARLITCYILKELTGLSLPQIGRAMGGRDHTTIIHAVRKVGGLLEAGDPETTAYVGALRRALGKGAAE